MVKREIGEGEKIIGEMYPLEKAIHTLIDKYIEKSNKLSKQIDWDKENSREDLILFRYYDHYIEVLYELLWKSFFARLDEKDLPDLNSHDCAVCFGYKVVSFPPG